MNTNMFAPRKDIPVIWIIGGAHFIGSYVCKLLQEQKVQVVAIDHVSTSVKQQFELIADKNRVIYVEHDINHYLSGHFRAPDYIFYCNPLNEHNNNIEKIHEYISDIRQFLEIAGTYKSRFLLLSLDNTSSPYSPDRNTNLGNIVGEEYSLAQSERFIEIFLARHAKEKQIDARVVKIGDVYGPGMLLRDNDRLGCLFKQALYRQKIQYDEQNVIAPLYIEDAARGILSAMFGAGTRNGIFSFAVEPSTISDFAKTIEAIVENKEMWFWGLGSYFGVKSNEYVLPAYTTVIDGARKTIEYFEQTKSLRHTYNPEIFSKEPKKVWHKKKLSIKTNNIVISLGIALSAVFVILAGNFSIGFGLLWLGNRLLITGNSFYAHKAFILSDSLISMSKVMVEPFEFIPGVGDLGAYGREVSYEGILAARLGKEVAQLYSLSSRLVIHTLVQTPANNNFDTGYFSQLGASFDVFSQKLAFLLAHNPTAVHRIGFKETESLIRIREKSDNLRLMINYLPELLGYNKQRTYLILFQDSSQLRPTGGVIQSIGFFTFQNGVLVGSEIYDSEWADNQLKGRVEPPEELKKHLGIINWYMRDANWSADFPTSASRVEWFIDKELEKRVDGVIAVDSEFVQNLYRAAVGIKPDEYSTRVYREIVDTIRKQGPRSAMLFSQVLFNSLEEKHMVIAIHDQNIQALIRELGWDGGVRKIECGYEQKECMRDYLMITDANVGANNENNGLKREFSLDMFVTPNNILHDLVVSYVNTPEGSAVQNKWYKGYVRFIIPQGAVMLKSEIINPRTGVRVNLTPDFLEEKGMQTAGMLIEIPDGEERQLVISWQTPSQEKYEHIKFLWQKQIGTSNEPVNIHFHYPQTSLFAISGISTPPSLTRKGVIGYTTNLQYDIEASGLWTDQK